MRLTMPTAILTLFAAPALAEPPQVVTDIPVTGSLVQQVMGDLGEVRVLIGEGSDPHHFQLRPSDARALQSADLLVWIGPELTPWLERTTANLGEGEALSLLHVPGTHLQEFGADHGDHDDAHEHEHADEHEHEHEEHAEDHAGHDHEHEDAGEDQGHDHDHAEDAQDEHGHDHDGIDPHAWLDPANAQLWLTSIAEALAARDPDNADAYASNAEAAIRRIDTLEQEINTRLEPVHDRSFVVFHDAYGYFTAHFGLQPGIAVSLGDASSPSAARLNEVSARIAESGAACAFPEYGHDPALIDSATEGSGIGVGAELDPAGRGLEAGAALYGELLQNMGNALADCLAKKD
ncbi:zinc ABC transporter substrate-binding protein [Paracoccus methylarcula]|uniref:High-affinity zinc uptake system protein ZnuA n=1 Tax=Paracoccus methylarcula TaxID=72022 RepID=A0A3R7ND55_9RHOB|nr:zinc ABC transporter substrate-binding protein [Paracoccus methylarcula]RNF35371.1 zinc ABC transporter substrate-binding protein [Paracoccus methylarcula]